MEGRPQGASRREPEGTAASLCTAAHTQLKRSGKAGNSNGRTALLTQNVRNCRVAEVCWSQ